MDLFEAMGEEIGREFAGRRQEMSRHFFHDADFASRLADALARDLPGRSALVISDVRTREASGAPVLAALRGAGFTVRECLVPDGPGGASPACDDRTKGRLASGLPAADLFVAVGSGVISDLTKWLAGDAGVPYATCATAASMNGYTAANVAPAIAGVKSLVRAAAPRVVCADPAVIRQAPFRLTTAGLGDVIAKPVSTADWILNRRLFQEPFSGAVARVINRIEPKYRDNPEGVARRDPAAIQALLEALIFSGCAMTLQGSSLPASGGEHLVSHTLDMLAHLDGTAHDLHGRQVGVGTLVAADLYQRLLAMPRPRFEARVVEFDRGLWGGIAEAVGAEHAKKVARVEEACRLLGRPGVWEEAREEIAPVLLSPKAIKDCLRAAGAAHRVEDLGCSRERFLTALRHCAAIRGRFTSIDLAWAAGILPAAAEEIVDAWLS